MEPSKLRGNNLTKSGRVTSDGLVSHPGGVEVLSLDGNRRPDGSLARSISFGETLPYKVKLTLSMFAFVRATQHKVHKFNKSQ